MLGLSCSARKGVLVRVAKDLFKELREKKKGERRIELWWREGCFRKEGLA